MNIRRRRVKQAVLLASIAFLSVVGCIMFYSPSAPVAEGQMECVKRLGSIYRILAARSHDGKALPESPGVDRDSAELAPLDADALGIENAYCPVIDYLTDGSVKSPFVLVYAIKERDSGNWKRISLNSGEPVPLAFVSESFGQPRSQFGEGLICYSDGSVRVGVLPTICWPIANTYTHDTLLTKEITIPDDDERFPYGKHVAAMKVQYLGWPTF